MRFITLGLVVFALAWLVLDLHWAHAVVLAGCLAGAWVLARFLLSSWRSRIVVTDTGIEGWWRGTRTRMAWGDVIKIDLGVASLAGGGSVRCAVILGGSGARIAFSDLSLAGKRRIVFDAGGPVPVHDVADPEILLVLAATRTGDPRFIPPDYTETEGPEEAAGGSAPRGRRVDVAGLGALVGKIGGKIAKAAGGILKTVKPGLALASGAVYTILFDWKFALGLMVMLLFHEYGHVHAMRRSGLPVRGIYFIPLLGAAAVTDGTWRTRSQQAYIALNGPLWGFYLTLPVFVASLVVGSSWPLLGAFAGWWSMVNLFNLLPINPLDGGRLLNAVSHSLHTKLGIALSAMAFVAGLGLAFALKIHLLVVVGVFGLLEFVSEIQASRTMARLALAGIGPRVPAEALVRLRTLVRPVFSPEDEVRLSRIEAGRIGRVLAMARVTPMTRARTALWGLAYAGLVAAFIAIMLIVSRNPAAGLAFDLLR